MMVAKNCERRHDDYKWYKHLPAFICKTRLSFAQPYSSLRGEVTTLQVSLISSITSLGKFPFEELEDIQKLKWPNHIFAQFIL